MNGLRKGLVFVLCPLLLVTLLGAAVATSSNVNLKNPDKIEGWLNDSGLYDHFVSNATKQAEKSAGDNSQSNGSVSLSDTAVQKAAESAFSSEQIQQYVNTFLDSNYAWLQGKTDKPDYKIDLTKAKLSFAQKVGQYVTTYTAGLPVCTAEQQAQAQNTDPLTATCRPAEITPEQAGAKVTLQISTGDFLSKPVITADTINPDNNAAAQPYYKKLSRLPEIYRLGTNLPYIFAGISFISILGIIFLSATRRGGFKKTGWTLVIAGVILVGAKVSADIAFSQLKQRVFNNASIGELQQSLTTFAHSVESAVTKTEMIFGVIYLVIAAIIFITLFATRDKEAKPNKKNKSKQAASTPVEQPANQQSAASRITPRSTGTPQSGSHATTAPTVPNAQPRPAGPTGPPTKPKRPRLIQ